MKSKLVKNLNRFASAVISLTAVSHAATNTWTGAIDSNWDTTTANWTSPTIWTNGDDAVFGPEVGTVNVTDQITINSLSATGASTSIAIGTGNTLSLSRATASNGALPWSKVSGLGTLVLNSAQAVNGTADWGQIALPAGFTGTLRIDKGRVYGNSSRLGGASSVVVNAGSQYLTFDGTGGSYTYNQAFTIAGNGWQAGDPYYAGALRLANGATLAGPVTLSANAAIMAGDNASSITGPITGAYELEFYNNAAYPQTLILTPTAAVQNSYGSTKLTGGATVKAGNPYAFSTGGLLMNGGKIQLNGNNFSFANLSGASGQVQNGSAATAAVITVGTDNSSTSYGGTLANGSTATLGLTKTGSGTLTLTGSTTYTGATTVNQGALSLSSSAMSGSGASDRDYQINSGGKLEITDSPTSPVLARNLVLTDGSSLSLIPNGSNVVIDALDVSTTGTVTLNLAITATGTFPLISYAGQTNPQPDYTLGALPSGVVATLVESATGVDLVVTSLGTLVWKGNLSQNWDTSTANWTHNGSPAQFQNNNYVRFDDTANGAGEVTVVLESAVSPTAVNFENETRNYTLQGAAGITGNGFLVKSGAARLTLANQNSYTGGTTIAAGTLELGDGTSNGAVAGDIVNDSNLVFNYPADQAFPGLITGTGTLTKTGAGTLTLTEANTYFGGTTIDHGTLRIGNVTLSGATTGTYDIDAGGMLRLDRAAAATPAWGNLSGAGTLALNTAQAVNGSADWGLASLPAEFTGILRIDRGRVYGKPASLGSATQVMVADGAQFLAFDPTNAAQTYPQSFSLNGMGWGDSVHHGALRVSNLNATFSGNVTLTGSAMVATQSPASLLDLSGHVSDGGAGHTLTTSAIGRITISGTISGATSVNAAAGTVNLNGVNDYTGTTTVNAGTLLLNGTLAAASAVTVKTGATLGGSGTAAGSVTIDAGGFVAPGATAATGALTTGTAVLDGTYLCQLGAIDGDQVIVTGTLTVNPGAAITVSTLGTPAADSYTIASFGSLSGTLPSVTGIPAGYAQVATATELKLVKDTGYQSWADSFAGLTDKTAEGDPDGDGIKNLVEYVIGGDPRVSSTEFLPKQAVVGTDLVLTYKRNDAAESDTSQTGQWSVDLTNWFPVAPVVVNENAADPDDMKIVIPMANAANGRLFGRLNVTKP